MYQKINKTYYMLMAFNVCAPDVFYQDTQSVRDGD